MNKVKFQENKYTSNYVSGGKGVLSIRGVQLVEIEFEIFKNNGDSYDEIFGVIGGDQF